MTETASWKGRSSMSTLSQNEIGRLLRQVIARRSLVHVTLVWAADSFSGESYPQLTDNLLEAAKEYCEAYGYTVTKT